MSDLVSIIMPSYNTAAYIEASIQSVIAQTHEDWELIIVDDCSTDNTDAIVARFDDPRIRYLKNDQNCGAALSRNRALREAQGKWIAFLDSDDLWASKKLEKQIQFMKEHHYVFSYTDYMTCLNGQWLPYVYTGPEVVTKRKMYNYCYVSTLTVMYDREAVGLVQIADLKKNNDYAMWLQIVEKGSCYRLGECLSYYIRRENSISSGSKVKLIKWHYILFRKGLNKGPFLANLLTVNNLFHGVIKKIRYKKKVSLEGGKPF